MPAAVLRARPSAGIRTHTHPLQKIYTGENYQNRKANVKSLLQAHTITTATHAHMRAQHNTIRSPSHPTSMERGSAAATVSGEVAVMLSVSTMSLNIKGTCATSTVPPAHTMSCSNHIPRHNTRTHTRTATLLYTCTDCKISARTHSNAQAEGTTYNTNMHDTRARPPGS